jgi:hypothetical protein
MGFEDAPPLAKLIITKVEKLDDYQKDKIKEQIDEDSDADILPARITVIFRAVGITCTASQLRALSTYFNGSNGGVPRLALLDMIKQEDNLDDNVDARGSRNSADISYEMLQRLQGMRQGSSASMTSPTPTRTGSFAGPQRRDSMDSVSSDIGLLQRGFSQERLEYLKQATMATRDTELHANQQQQQQQQQQQETNNDGEKQLETNTQKHIHTSYNDSSYSH